MRRVAETFGKRVKQARELRGLGNNELDRKIGKQPGYSSRIERDERRHPRSDAIQRLAEVLQVRVDWLLKGEPPMVVDRPSPPDRFPHRSEAARIAREGGVSEDAVASVLDDKLELERDPPVLWWLDRMRERVVLLKYAGPGR